MSIRAHDGLIQRSSTFPSTRRFVFLKEKWQDCLVPVENGSTKRGGRLLGFAGYSSVLPLGYKMSWVLRGARAVDLSSNSEFFAPSPDETGGF